MDINFDQFSHDRRIDLPENTGGYGHPDGTGPIDWSSLAARLTAAQAARQVLAAGSSLTGRHPAIACGSFAPALAPRISAYLARAPEGYTIPDVNQDAKATGNPIGTIADDSKAAVRP
ncbi:MAG: hypothetical protein M3N34_08500 [Pseudomonadota bacterium]|nr:hypothetical protein [Pseudomonadota bacterium]